METRYVVLAAVSDMM